MHTTLALLAARTIATDAAPSGNPFTFGTATPRTPERARRSDGQNVTRSRTLRPHHHSAFTIGHGHHVSQSTDRQNVRYFRKHGSVAALLSLLPNPKTCRFWFWFAFDSAASTSRSYPLNHWSAGPFSGRSTRPFAQIRLGSLKSSPCH